MPRKLMEYKPPPPPRVEIINLIDVLITLIAFFLLTTIFRQAHPQLAINLPSAQHARPAEGQVKTIYLTLSRDGRLVLEGRQTSIEKLSNELQKYDHDCTIIIRADEKCYYEDVINILDNIKYAGFSKIGLETLITGEQ